MMVSMHGARLICKINGVVVGQVIDFSFTSSTGVAAKRGIDIVIPQELAPTAVSVSGSISLLRTIGDGGAQGVGLVPSQIDAHKGKYVTLLLVERTTNTAVFKCDYALINAESWNIGPRKLMVGSIGFEGITWTNEAA